MGRLKHGLSQTRAYSSWNEMIRRCENPKAVFYKDYGGRGITVCERWHNVVNFYEDMGERPIGTSIGRIDNDKGYYKENCRWETEPTQKLNTSRNRRLFHDGQSKTIREWSDSTGIDYYALLYRIRRGWDIKRALSEPTRLRSVP